MFNERTSNNSLSSTIVNKQETLNGTTNQTQQATPSLFVNKEIVETLPTTTQQSISPIHPTVNTTHNKNINSFSPTTLQRTVKPSVVPRIPIWLIKHLDQ